MRRRTFCIGAAGVALAPALAAASSDKKRRVAVIGHTGRGNFGHGLDRVWLNLPDAEIVAVADADSAGLAEAKERLHVEQGYGDYRKMLEEVDAEFVAVCPRHVDQHRDMAMAAIEAGAKGIYIEKPFCRTPAEVDELRAACERHGTKIAVAHRNRYHPALKVIDKLIADGRIGRLLEIRGRGKGDRRGGGEDLWVLGTHVMNLMHYFAGEPKSCSAIMRQQGRPVTKDDVVDGGEGLGPLAGDEVHARFEMADGVIAHYQTIANDGTGGDAYAMQLIGSEGIVNIGIDRNPLAHLIPGNPYSSTGEPRPWLPITSAGVDKAESDPGAIGDVRNHTAAVRDLIDACDDDRDPVCDLHEGLMTVEMCCSVFESHRLGGARVPFPLEERGNALRHL